LATNSSTITKEKKRKKFHGSEPEKKKDEELLVHSWIQAKETTNRSGSKGVRSFQFKSPNKTQVKHLNTPLSFIPELI